VLTVGKVSIAGQMVYGDLATKATGLAAEFQRSRWMRSSWEWRLSEPAEGAYGALCSRIA